MRDPPTLFRCELASYAFLPPGPEPSPGPSLVPGRSGDTGASAQSVEAPDRPERLSARIHTAQLSSRVVLERSSAKALNF